LERIFIENKTIVTLRKKPTRRVIQAVDDGLKPHKTFKRAVTEEDILRLLDIRMRISKFDSNKAKDKIEALKAI
jgi:topoisomerase-4 subunit A